ncbi:MAG: ADP-ribosylglycohydrolase family protein [Lunatimonas sp.]|uniref:ADP-ribosylglycohydrolase family protein n=1 Tax=Lunatimonas sp. TaxID=2060141 RepID=UPI00263B2406|nr:ADP-ribosylglycohydrolase family protein [Lunatimonas sp.]MCC5938795.1 ADP-ribosylglycohydrolase family protein [Lunatimonas sp.]
MHSIIPQTLIFALLTIGACLPQKADFEREMGQALPFDEDVLNDKVLGLLVGTAIGDAMGAPTEMWPRTEINAKYGWVDRLDTMVREVSPEGIWVADLPAGGTTDDTRWKKLTVEYLHNEPGHELSAKRFARHILTQYQSYLDERKTIGQEDSLALEENFLRVGWLQEWAKVSGPYVQNDYVNYLNSLSTFYGGEMVCAGLLYSPAIGGLFPGQAEKAYSEAFKLAIFDLGYARDISALAAAMTAAAMKPGATPEDVIAVIRTIDPYHYGDARLVGRTAQRILGIAESIVANARTESRQIDGESSKKQVVTRDEMQVAFVLLDEHLQDMPFHAGEIFLQVITAMLLSDFDFELTLQFLVNYGRDNDTTAAIAGAILGAYWGIAQLPETMYQQVLNVSKKQLDLDILDLAKIYTQKVQSIHSRPSG